MPSTREIRRRIRSVKNLAQITRAMEMVAASKMRRAQRNVIAARPYADRLLELMGDLNARAVVRKGTLLEVRDEVKSVAVLVITPDRGLAGSLVTNVLRSAARVLLDERKKGRAVVSMAIGKKGRDFLARNSGNLVAEVTRLGDTPKVRDIIGIASALTNGFLKSEYDEVYLVYAQFVNTLVQRPIARRILPIDAPADTRPGFDFNYEPDRDDVMDELLPRFIESELYQALLEAIASEHSARMVAMRNATDNAKDLQRDLTLTYNKTRQANITKEVTEITSGVAALS